MFTARIVMVATVLLLGAAHGAAGQSLYADPKARAVGDVVTIILQEQTSAQSESSYETDDRAGLSARASVEGPTLASRFGTDASFSRDVSSENEAAQREMLNGRLTARVTGRDDAGNLRVEGERTISVNGSSHLMRVTGLVRPLDVRYDNTVLSPQIANARVVYRRSGGVTESFFKPGFMATVGAVGAVVAAVLLGT